MCELTEGAMLEPECRLTVRSSRGAAVGVVAKGVDMHTTLSVGIVAGDIVGDGCWCVLVGLLEGHGALDIGVTSKNSNCCTRSAIGLARPPRYCWCHVLSANARRLEVCLMGRAAANHLDGESTETCSYSLAVLHLGESEALKPLDVPALTIVAVF